MKSKAFLAIACCCCLLLSGCSLLAIRNPQNNSLQEIADKMKLPYSVLKRRHQALLKKMRVMLEG